MLLQMPRRLLSKYYENIAGVSNVASVIYMFVSPKPKLKHYALYLPLCKRLEEVDQLPAIDYKNVEARGYEQPMMRLLL